MAKKNGPGVAKAVLNRITSLLFYRVAGTPR
jgi:hypothetical protein